MPDLAVSSSDIRPVYVQGTGGLIIKAVRSGEALAAGDVVYLASTGKVLKADSDALASMPAYGIALTPAGGDGEPVSVLMAGWIAGFTLTGLNPHAPVYVSGTPGRLTDTKPSGTGKVVQVAGRVDVDANGNKLLHIMFDWAADYTALP